MVPVSHHNIPSTFSKAESKSHFDDRDINGKLPHKSKLNFFEHFMSGVNLLVELGIQNNLGILNFHLISPFCNNNLSYGSN